MVTLAQAAFPSVEELGILVTALLVVVCGMLAAWTWFRQRSAARARRELTRVRDAARRAIDGAIEPYERQVDDFLRDG